MFIILRFTEHIHSKGANNKRTNQDKQSGKIKHYHFFVLLKD
jgi:hypothetical protein